MDLAFLIVFLFDFYIGKICVLPHAEFVVFLVLCQIVLSPSVEAGDEFLHAPPVSEVLGALDLRDASLEGLALEGEEEVVGFQLQDEVRDDLDKGEEQMLLLLVAAGLNAERASRHSERSDIVAVLDSTGHHLDVLVQQLGILAELKALQVSGNLRALFEDFVLIMGLIVEGRVVFPLAEDVVEVDLGFPHVLDQHLDKLEEVLLAVADSYLVALGCGNLHDARNDQKFFQILVELRDLPAGFRQFDKLGQAAVLSEQDQGHDLGAGLKQP